jgi:dedicator of cytokinesis protein 3
MPWRPLPRIAFGVCIYPFSPSAPADLPLEIGDELYIIEQGGKDGSWYRGYLVAPPSLLAGLTSVQGQTLEARVFSGIFPRACVEIREVLGEDKNRLRAEDVSQGLTGGKPSTRASHASLTANGVLTPTGSVSPDAGASITQALSRRPSRGDIVTDAGPGIPVSRIHKAKSLRLTKRVSAQTMRSEASQPILPMSPMSPMSSISRDPEAPRPPAPVPMLKIGDETPTSSSEPLVDEIASCLREWHSTKLHDLLLGRHYSTLEKMSTLVSRLDTSRRQLLHRVLTDQELGQLRESTVWDLVNGNKALCGEVIVRSPSQRGRVLTGDDSPIEVTKLQSEMSLLAEKPVTPSDDHVPHHLLVEFPQAFGELTTSKTIAVHLVSKAAGMPAQPVSEVHAINVSPSTGTAPDGNMRTLFVDIGAADIGEGSGTASNLYVVFKVIVNESLRPPQTSHGQPRDSTSSQGGFTPSQAGTLRGRRSLMWGKVGQERPRTSEVRDTLDEKEGNNKVEEKRPSTRADKQVKRTVAAALIRVDHLIKQDFELERELIFWSPSSYPAEEPSEHDAGWDSMIKEVFPTTGGEYHKYNFPKAVKVFVKPFSDPDAEELIKKTPTLLQNISQTRKIGFVGAPSKPRSDIYLTLSEIVLPRHAFLAHPKSGTVPLGTLSGLSNLQLTLEVRRSNGQRIENCIFPSCNSQGHTAWRTTAAERGEPWNLTIRLAISPDDVPGSHIVMSIADLPGFPFALCWMPLWNDGAFIQDSSHSLSLYQYDEYTSSIISGRGAYLGLPWAAMRRDDPNVGPMATLSVATYLCSTKYSQDPTLLGLLKWSTQPAGTLPGLLRRFQFVPEIEVVKLLPEVFDALFEVLNECAGSEEYENLVFNDLVFVLGIVYDRRFKLAPLVDQYAESRMKYPSTATCLVRTFIRLLSTPTDTETSKRLRATFKVTAHLFRFISCAWQQQERLDREGTTPRIERRKSAFIKDIHDIFESLESLMKNPNPILIGTKTLIVQHFHSWLPELTPFMGPHDILDTAIGFVDSCNNVKGKLILYKLVLIIHLSELDAIKLPETKRVLRINTVRWLAPYWGREEMVNDQWKDQVRLCCSVVASQLSELGEEGCEYIPKLVDSYRAVQSADRPTKKQLSLLFPTSYPFQSKPIASQTTEFDEPLVEIAAVLAGITSMPTTIHIDLPESELAEFLFSALQVYISILDGEAYPHSWLSVHIYHHKSTMRSLEKLSSILIDSFLPHPDEAEQFNTELWRTFFEALLKLVGSEALALETFPEQKRRAVWKIAGDVRELGADLLRRSWEAIGWETSPEDKTQYGLEKLGGYQVQYIPTLVGPIMELCLSVHEGLRSVAIQILQTMIISEWTLSSDLAIIQAEIIECLDKLFRIKNQTENVTQKLFVTELLETFESLARDAEDDLVNAVKALVATIDELLDLLVAVHSTDGAGEAIRLMETLHLMEFLKDMQKVDIFIGYVHQLAGIQAKAKNYTEAGLALRLHADLYDWDPSATVEELRNPPFPKQTAFERKEQLYFQMIKYYEDGQSWDNALGSYMELADQYEHNVFDFAKLARAQRAMATIYESISKGSRENPRYFRVTFHGFGFPVSLREKQYIYQGLSTDRVASFIDRLQQQHPSARIYSGGSGVDQDLEGQYIHVYHVSPQKDIQHPIYRRAKVAQAVRDYYLLSRPGTFTSSKRKGSGGDPREVAVEKTVYTTAEAFPTILKKSEIVDIGSVTLTPLQGAIERTTRKTAELLALDRKLTMGDDAANITALTDAIMLSVDANSEASVSHYRDLLATKAKKGSDDGVSSVADDDDLDDDEVEKPLDPQQEALKIALIDHALAVKKCLNQFSRPAHQATKADLQQRKLFLSRSYFQWRIDID